MDQVITGTPKKEEKEVKKPRRSKRSDGITISPSLERMKFGLASPATRKGYVAKLGLFFDFVGLTDSIEQQANTFVQKAIENGGRWVSQVVYEYLRAKRDLVDQGKLGAGSLHNYLDNVQAFCEANEYELGTAGIINWKRISKGLPKRISHADDRCPTIEEIRKLLKYPDRRIGPLVLVMCSSGIRLGAWEYLRWKHVKPVKNDNGQVIIAAELLVYAGTPEQYTTYMTGEAFRSLNDWMEFRRLHGEEINGNSWLMRDLWEASNIKREAIRSLAKNPKQLKVSGIKHLLNKAWKVQGVRGMLKDDETRHPFKEAHGFRKYFHTFAIKAGMNLYDVEILMGHDIGLAGSYYKPEGLLEQYLKAIPLLTINEVDKATAEQTRKELEELKSERIDHTEIARLRADQEELKKLMRTVYRLVIDKDTIAEVQMPHSSRHNIDSNALPPIVKELNFIGLKPSEDATMSHEWDLEESRRRDESEERLKVEEK